MIWVCGAFRWNELNHEVSRAADAALASLFNVVPEARTLAATAEGVLVFPTIVNRSGIQSGHGVLRQQDRNVGFYIFGSHGLQAAVETFAYALFFMSDSALRHLNHRRGFKPGVESSIVVVDVDRARALTPTTAHTTMPSSSTGMG